MGAAAASRIGACAQSLRTLTFKRTHTAMHYLDKARQALQVECLQRRMLGRSRLFTHPGTKRKEPTTDSSRNIVGREAGGLNRTCMAARCEWRGGRLRLA